VAEETSFFERFTNILKNLVAALRDTLLFVLFLLLLFSPSTVNNRLVSAGFTKGNIGGLEWEGQLKKSTEQTKTVGEAVSKADDDYQALIDRLAQLEKSVNDPAIKKSITSISADAKESQGQLAVADQAVKKSLSTQQDIAEKIAPSSVAAQGWLFLGKVSEDKSAWMTGSPATIAKVDAALKQGDKLTIRDDAYLRAPSKSGSHASAAIVSVAKVGSSVVVDEVDYSHAAGGGWFVWVNARKID